ncbi:molybdopterin-dependent oxidoreductase [Cellulomonas marina]|uniref:Oxidoreductase molybdopterin-binding domain-containing protein n=1 Tax=Cellulomonas marina TaxID=988821 RepID=A0A1I0V734_9CELL|nr:molybdopterin-dependent oxidoreductase [Cellulomonas marina]GIG28366.1 hypothetical protein Cma02nite_09660 [Cellulomonas marina]SFA71893.1 hypothetical protein SAMN05421867_101194 [Cellulomonas marina]
MRARPRALLVLCLAGAAVAGLASCSDGTSAQVHAVSAGTVVEVADLTTPAAEDVVLTVEGTSSGTVTLSMADLEAMPTVEAEVYEPFLEERVTFRGVALAELLRVVGVPQDATVLHSLALNDYAVDVPLTVADHPGAVLATRADGEPIPLEEGGPTRLVLTDDHPDTRDQSLWIWSIASLAADSTAP